MSREHISSDTVPPALKERWETWPIAVRLAWKVAEKKAKIGTSEMVKYWKLMGRYGSMDMEELKEAARRQNIPWGTLTGEFSAEEEAKLKEIGAEEATGNIPLTQEQAKRCAELGEPVEPHWMTVAKYVSEGMSPQEAAKKAQEEGKWMGTSKLACRALLGKRGEL